MLREFQDEIRALRAQLEATQRGVMIGDDGKVITRTAVCEPVARGCAQSLACGGRQRLSYSHLGTGICVVSCCTAAAHSIVFYNRAWNNNGTVCAGGDDAQRAAGDSGEDRGEGGDQGGARRHL
jgi:hypothetical protein